MSKKVQEKKEKKTKTRLPAGGAPTLYQDGYAEKAFSLCLLGSTDADLALIFSVSIDTITEWKKVHPEFSASIKRGRIEADADVAKSLYKRACGYECIEEKVFTISGEPLIVKINKHVPADPACISIWLRNRQGKFWKTNPSDKEQDASNATPVSVHISVTDASKRDS